MTSKLPKPSGLKLPQVRIPRPLEPIPENYLNRPQRIVPHEAPPASTTRIIANPRLKRRSKSVTDLRSIVDKPLVDLASLKAPMSARKTANVRKFENKPAAINKSTVTGKVGLAGTKRPLAATKTNGSSSSNSSDGPTKPKVAKKIPDWDYKGRFHQLNEKYSSAQETLKDLKSKLVEFDEIKPNYVRIQAEAKELLEAKTSLFEKCEELSTINQELLKSNEKLERELALLEKNYRNLDQEYQRTKEENEFNLKEVTRLNSSLSSLTELYEKLTKEHSQLKKAHEDLSAKYNFFTNQNRDLLDCLNLVKKENEEYKEVILRQKNDLQSFQDQRRALHNTIQDLKGNIRVFCRIRPPKNNDEMNLLQCNINYIDENGLEIKKSRESVSQITGKIQDLKSEFTYDKVFSPDSTQEEVFEDLAQLVQSALDGYDICVFAYGQTGSGKTFTMQGGETFEQRGMVPRTIDLIFENIERLERSGWKYNVQASFLEIYNENVRDLLNMNSTQKLEIYYNDGKGTTVTNLTIQSIRSAEELKDYMRLAHRNRATAATDFNEHSSRSHAVTKIYLQGTMQEQNVIYKGSINLVDLAGSESAKQSANMERLTETKNINKSLATLGDVIAALHSKSKHIPYRNSKLTYLLQSCLGGNSKTLMVVNVAPFEECFGETINSLRFAAKVKEVKTGSRRNKVAIVPPMLKEKSTL